MSFRKKEISIQLIYGVADYFEIRIIYSFRKKEKKFHHHFKNFIVTSKVIEKSSKDASLVKAYYQSRAFQWKHQRGQKQRDQTKFK